MSGICGLFNLDDAPVDRALMQQLTDYLAFRGPDGQRMWRDGPVGLGHTLLSTVVESEGERQPASLDGRIWITADARIDDQARLKRDLVRAGRIVAASVTDAQLILHAYHAWGEKCLQHLLGDFAFAIWDGQKRSLFCARDHFGVKPFFYSAQPKMLVFSNTLNGVRQHPAVSGVLNDLAIADFLLFDDNQEPDTTAFAEIRRLPPAHALLVSAEATKRWRYWAIPSDLSICERSEKETVDGFREVLESAVADRLRGSLIGVEMSGGLDSASIAAMAKAVLERRGQPYTLHAHTIVYDRLVPDEERRFSEMVAEFLGIGHFVLAADDYGLFDRCEETLLLNPEPVHDPTAVRMIDLARGLPMDQRVVLTGWDGDALLNESPKPWFRQLWRQRHLQLLLRSMAGHAIRQRRWFPLAWRDRLLGRPHPSLAEEEFPGWIDPGLDRRLGLRDRFRSVQNQQQPSRGIRPKALRELTVMQNASNFFDGYDAGVTRRPLEYRHPLLDLRLIEFCLTLPPYPWCVSKHVLRLAMRGRLPEAILTRPKTALQGFPYLELIRALPLGEPGREFAIQSSEGYIDARRVPKFWTVAESQSAWVNLRPFSLDRWLGRESATNNDRRGGKHMTDVNPPKRAYQPPTFNVYGSIKVLTQAVNMMGNLDGGGGMTTKSV